MVSSAFAGQCEYQADMLNLSRIRVSFVRHPISDATSQDIVKKAEETYTHAVEAIKMEEGPAFQDWVHVQSKDAGEAEPQQECGG